MKKLGEWIATFGPSLHVSRIGVEASTALDLIEVRTIGPDEEVTNIFFFDRVEGRALVDALLLALEQLAAGDKAPAAGPSPERFQLAYLRPAQEGEEAYHGVWDSLAKSVLSHRWPMGGKSLEDAEAWVARSNKEHTGPISL